MNLYQKIFKAFKRKKIDYLLVGGVAVNLYGYPRFTGDIDILLSLTLKNLEKVDELMSELGYTKRLPIMLKELGERKKLEKFIEEKNLKAYTFVSKGNPPLDIDIITQESIDFNDYKKKRTLIEVWGLQLPVVAMDDLIKMKKVANREKDLLDIEALLKLKEL